MQTLGIVQMYMYYQEYSSNQKHW